MANEWLKNFAWFDTPATGEGDTYKTGRTGAISALGSGLAGFAAPFLGDTDWGIQRAQLDQSAMEQKFNQWKAQKELAAALESAAFQRKTTGRQLGQKDTELGIERDKADAATAESKTDIMAQINKSLEDVMSKAKNEEEANTLWAAALDTYPEGLVKMAIGDRDPLEMGSKFFKTEFGVRKRQKASTEKFWKSVGRTPQVSEFAQGALNKTAVGQAIAGNPIADLISKASFLPLRAAEQIPRFIGARMPIGMGQGGGQPSNAPTELDPRVLDMMRQREMMRRGPQNTVGRLR